MAHPLSFFYVIHKRFTLHLYNITKIPLILTLEGPILRSVQKKGGTAMTYENKHRTGDVDDMIFSGGTVIPSQR